MNNEAKLGPVTVGGQPDAADVARFQTIVNCRPESEPGNVTAELVRGAAIRYTGIPFTAGTLSKRQIDEMRAALDAATGATLVHCAGGTRAAVAVAVVQAERAVKGAAEAIAACEAAGFAVTGGPYAAFITSYFAGRG